MIVFWEIVDLRNYVNDFFVEKFVDIFFNERMDYNEIDFVLIYFIKVMLDWSWKLVIDKNIIFYSVFWWYDDVISLIYYKEYLLKLCFDLLFVLK